MGEAENQPFQLSFNTSLQAEFQGSRVTSDGSLILVRELDERLGFGEWIEEHLRDQQGTNARLSLADLLKQSVDSRLAGYEDVNDAERLCRDPTFRLIGSGKVWDRGVALTSGWRAFKRRRNGAFRRRWKHRAVKTRRAISYRGGRMHAVGRAGVYNGNSR